jgi:CheY-like chemotaxis protein
MPLTGPILLIEDDRNDAEVITAAIKDLAFRNEIIHFLSAGDALAYLFQTKQQPLIIISDIRMPVLNGLSLLRQIQSNEFLKMKAVPFVFLTGVVARAIVNEAYSIGVQGFYVKPHVYEELKEQLYFILHYWSRCVHPNSAGLE